MLALTPETSLISQNPEVSFHRIVAFAFAVGRYTEKLEVAAGREIPEAFKVKVFELYTVVPLIWKSPPTTKAPVDCRLPKIPEVAVSAPVFTEVLACRILTVPDPVTVRDAVFTELLACNALTVPEPVTVSVVVFTDALACNVLTVPEPVTVSVVVLTDTLACKVLVITELLA